jgi:membrane dipeptidase
VGELYAKPRPDSQQKEETASNGTDRINDYTIRAIAKNGGAICLHFVTPEYVKPRHGTPKATVADLVDHIEYIRNLAGIDYVSLGPDFFPRCNGSGSRELASSVWSPTSPGRW